MYVQGTSEKSVLECVAVLLKWGITDFNVNVIEDEGTCEEVPLVTFELPQTLDLEGLEGLKSLASIMQMTVLEVRNS